jgi:acetoin utilization deacetylase AcuC-like enzyme
MKKFYISQLINTPIIQDLVLNKKKGKYNNIFNIPLEAGTTSEKYLTAYEHVLSKIIEFKPEFLLFSAGFDAHKDDPLAQLKLNSNDFYTLTKRTLEASKKFCNGKVVSILEGGYDLNALMSSTEKHVDALLEFN